MLLLNNLQKPATRTFALLLLLTIVDSKSALAHPFMAYQENQQYVNTQEQASTQMIVELLTPVSLDGEKDRSYQLAGVLKLPLQLAEQIVPAGAVVKLRVVSTDTGDGQLIADTIITPDGTNISINAASEPIPGQTVTVRRRLDVAKEYTAVGGTIGVLIGTVLGEDTEDIIGIGAGGATGGFLVGVLSPEKVRVVQVPQGIYFLNVE